MKTWMLLPLISACGGAPFETELRTLESGIVDVDALSVESSPGAGDLDAGNVEASDPVDGSRLQDRLEPLDASAQLDVSTPIDSSTPLDSYTPFDVATIDGTFVDSPGSTCPLMCIGTLCIPVCDGSMFP